MSRLCVEALCKKGMLLQLVKTKFYPLSVQEEFLAKAIARVFPSVDGSPVTDPDDSMVKVNEAGKGVAFGTRKAPSKKGKNAGQEGDSDAEAIEGGPTRAEWAQIFSSCALPADLESATHDLIRGMVNERTETAPEAGISAEELDYLSPLTNQQVSGLVKKIASKASSLVGFRPRTVNKGKKVSAVFSQEVKTELVEGIRMEIV